MEHYAVYLSYAYYSHGSRHCYPKRGKYIRQHMEELQREKREINNIREPLCSPLHPVHVIEMLTTCWREGDTSNSAKESQDHVLLS